jgi:DNA-binding response OmpR family regulator
MPNILLGDNDHGCREFIAFVLRQANYRVYEAFNGAQVVQIVRDEPIDLVMLEVRLPMLTGYEAARMIGRESPSTPVMFVSARGLRSEVEKAFDCAPLVVDYLIKPVLAAQLVRRVDSVLRVSRTYGIDVVRQESLARPDLAYVRLRP